MGTHRHESYDTYTETSDIHVAAADHVERLSRIWIAHQFQYDITPATQDAPKVEAPGRSVVVSLPALIMSLRTVSGY